MKHENLIYLKINALQVYFTLLRIFSLFKRLIYNPQICNVDPHPVFSTKIESGSICDNFSYKK